MMIEKIANALKETPAWATVVAALIALCATSISLFAGTLISEILKKRSRRLELAIARADEQIGKFYAPLAILTSQLTEVDKVKRTIVQQDNPHKSMIEQVAYNVYFNPIHEKINQILQSQLHLLEGDEIPDSIDDYYKHVASEKVLYLIRQKIEEENNLNVIPVSFAVFPFPSKFPEEIIKGLKIVQKRQDNLLRMLDKRRTYG